MTTLLRKVCARLLLIAVSVVAAGCALTTSVLNMGQGPDPAQSRPECVADDGETDILVRAGSIGGQLLAARSLTDEPGVPSGWLQLTTPVAVVAQSNDVFIADLALRQVIKFNRGTQRASVFVDLPDMTINTRLYLDRALSLYVTQPLAGKVTQYDLDGRPVRTFGAFGETANPVATVVDDARGEILIADQIVARISVLNRNGGLVRAIGADAAGGLRFGSIGAMANAGDQLYVVDSLEGQVAALGLGGNFRYAFGQDELIAPGAIAADNDNRVFVADTADASIKVFRGGRLQSVVGTSGDRAGIGFRGISDLWASDDSLYVADAQRGAVDILEVQRPCP